MTELLRTLRLHDLALLIVGAVIGSGIFLVPAQVCCGRSTGSTGLATLVWLEGGVLALLGALTCGELATMKLIPQVRWHSRHQPVLVSQ